MTVKTEKEKEEAITKSKLELYSRWKNTDTQE